MTSAVERSPSNSLVHRLRASAGQKRTPRPRPYRNSQPPPRPEALLRSKSLEEPALSEAKGTLRRGRSAPMEHPSRRLAFGNGVLRMRGGGKCANAENATLRDTLYR